MATAQQSPRFTSFNYRDAFSHSETCDAILSLGPGSAKRFCGLAYTIGIDSVDLPAIPQSFTVDLFKHKGCRCWCHTAGEYLYDPTADSALPEEYLTSADRAFILDEPAGVKIEFQEFSVPGAQLPETEPDLGEFGFDYAEDDAGGPVRGMLAGPVASRTGFVGWSREELQRGKCGNCGDRLADCECVE